MLVWGVDLVIFYGFNSPTFGEPWTDYSYLQVVGVVLGVVIGVVVGVVIGVVVGVVGDLCVGGGDGGVVVSAFGIAVDMVAVNVYVVVGVSHLCSLVVLRFLSSAR